MATLVNFAAAHSPYYQTLYSGRDAGSVTTDTLHLLPVTTKQQLMVNSESTNRDVTFSAVAAFVADPDRVGEMFLDRFAVWTTSGGTGRPGVFLHDVDALAVYQALVTRLYLSVLSLRLVRRRVSGRRRTAAIFVTAGTSLVQRG